MLNLVTLPVDSCSRDHLAFLQYRIDKLESKLRRALARIFAAQRSQLSAAPSWVTPSFEVIPAPPVKCKHGLREAWCAACVRLALSGPSKQRGTRSLRFQGMRRAEIGTHDGDTIGKVSVIRVEAGVCLIGLDDVDDLLADEKAEQARENKVKRLTKEAAQGREFTFHDGSPKTERVTQADRRYSRCLGCRKPFAARSRFEFCGETEKKNGTCKRAWLENHQPLCVSRGVEVPLREVRPQFSIAFTQQRRALTIACEIRRRGLLPIVKEPRSVRPVALKVVRRTQTAMGELMKLYVYVTEKMRGAEESDVWATVEPMPYKQALRYLRGCDRWLTEKKMAGKHRTLNDILLESRTLSH